MGRYLDMVNSPADVKLLTLEQLGTLAQEIRDELITVLSKTGGHLAFLAFEKMSMDLMLHRPGEQPPPSRIERGAFSYAFAPDDRSLYYRSACVREGRACDLSSRQLERDPGVKKLAEGVWDFRAADSGGRLIVTYARTDLVAAADLAYLNLDDPAPQPKGIDQVTLGVPLFLDRTGKRVAYIVTDRKREGVYVADLP